MTERFIYGTSHLICRTQGDILMENRKPSFSPDDSDVATWALPEGAIARLGRGSVGNMAFSPDGQYFAIGSWIGLWLYELPTLTPIALWDTERGMTGGASFSPDGNQIVTSTSGGNVKIWDTEQGVCTTEIDDHGKQAISNPIFSEDGQYLAAANCRVKNGKIYVWCPHTGTKVRETEILSPYDVYPLCFSPDLSLMAGKNNEENNRDKDIGDGDSITVWQVDTGEQIANITGHSERVRKFCFSPCGRFLAAGSWHGTIHVWDVVSGQLETSYTDYGESQMYPYFLPAGELITAAVSERKIEIWYVEKGEKLDEFGHRGSRSTVHFSDSGTQLALANPCEIQIWTKGNNSDAHTLLTLHGHISTMDTLVFSANEKTLASASWGDNVLLWDITSKRSYHPQSEKLPASSHNVYRSPSGKIIAINVYGDNLNVLEVGKREPLAELTGLEGGVGRAKAFSPTGHRIASVDANDNIHIWECSGGESWKKHTTVINDEEFIYGLRHSPTGLVFSPDGKRLASISRSRDWKAGLWDVDTGKQIAELPLKPLSGRTYRGYDTGIAFSPRGDIIAGGKWGEIVLWDSTDGKVLMTLPQPEESQRPITLCFSPCGEYLASGAWWQGGLQKVPIRLWEVATGKNIATFWGHTTDVQCFAFSQDGTLLVSGGHDGAIYLWDLTPYL
jgi:WD40 repeat protein